MSLNDITHPNNLMLYVNNNSPQTKVQSNQYANAAGVVFLTSDPTSGNPTFVLPVTMNNNLIMNGYNINSVGTIQTGSITVSSLLISANAQIENLNNAFIASFGANVTVPANLVPFGNFLTTPQVSETSVCNYVCPGNMSLSKATYSALTNDATTLFSLSKNGTAVQSLQCTSSNSGVISFPALTLVSGDLISIRFTSGTASAICFCLYQS